MLDLQLRQRSVGQLAVSGINGVIGKHTDAAEKPRQHNVPATGVPGAGEHQVIRDDPQPRAQREYVPTLFSQNGDRRIRPRNWITLARDGLDQCRLAAAVGSENGNVLLSANTKAEVVERDLLSP